MTIDIGPNLLGLISNVLGGVLLYLLTSAVAEVAKAWIRGRGAVKRAEIRAGLCDPPGGRK